MDIIIESKKVVIKQIPIIDEYHELVYNMVEDVVNHFYLTNQDVVYEEWIKEVRERVEKEGTFRMRFAEIESELESLPSVKNSKL